GTGEVLGAHRTKRTFLRDASTAPEDTRVEKFFSIAVGHKSSSPKTLTRAARNHKIAAKAARKSQTRVVAGRTPKIGLTALSAVTYYHPDDKNRESDKNWS